MIPLIIGAVASLAGPAINLIGAKKRNQTAQEQAAAAQAQAAAEVRKAELQAATQAAQRRQMYIIIGAVVLLGGIAVLVLLKGKK